MKKIRIISITIVTVLIGVILSTYINKPKSIDNGTTPTISNEEYLAIDKSTQEVMPDGNLTFSVLGDVHGNINSLQDAIKDLNTINPHMDALILNGDTVDQGKEEQYNSVKEVIWQGDQYRLSDPQCNSVASMMYVSHCSVVLQ